MRTLFVAAAVLFSVTATQWPALAQEPAVPSSQSIVDQLKSAGEIKGDQASQPTPAQAAPIAAKPAEAKPTESKPAPVVTEARPVKKRVVKKRETDEQKARRIAAKYGVYW